VEGGNQIYAGVPLHQLPKRYLKRLLHRAHHPDYVPLEGHVGRVKHVVDYEPMRLDLVRRPRGIQLSLSALHD
jgi:hypothetical protein